MGRPLRGGLTLAEVGGPGPAPLTSTERAAVARAIVRCHAAAGLTPPARVVWLPSVDAAQRYRDAVRAGRPGDAPTPTAVNDVGLVARIRRTAVVPALGVRGLLWGVLAALMGALLVVALPFFLLLFAWFALYIVPGSVLLRGLRPAPTGLRSTVLGLAFAAGFIGWILLGGEWMSALPRWAFVPPDPVLAVALPLVMVGAVVGTTVLRVRTALRRLRPGPDPDAQDEVERRLRGLRWDFPSAPDASPVGVLARAMPQWQPFPPPGAWEPGDRPQRKLCRRYDDAATASRVLWSACPGLVVAVDPPRELHAGPDGLHRLDGPAVVWTDGTAEHHVHGVRVPAPGPDGWTVDDVHGVANSEARRVMIETMGWEEYLRGAGLAPVADAPDPGNAPHRLELYALPDEVFGPLRLLVMVNGSPDRGGRARRYAEFVPAGLDDPVEAAAWQYGLDVEVYRLLQRRT